VTELDACLLARFPGTRPPDWLRRWLDDGLGGVLLFADNITGPEQLGALAAELRAHNPDVLIAADEEGGIVTRAEARTGSSYPGNGALGAVGDLDLTRRVAASIGAMLAAGGVNLDLAPSADVDSNPANPVIGVRSFGSDPGQVAAHTVAFVEGIQSNLVAACAKHFPGHGGADADSHVALPVAGASLRELGEADLVPFRAAIGAGVRSVMTAHVVFPAVDQVPATVSRRFLAGMLRGELGFGGVIITDSLGMAAIGDGEVSAEGAVRSLAAGADLLCLPEQPAAQRRARDALAAAVRDRVLPSGRVAESAARVSALAAWARARPASAADPSLGAEAARRALLVDTANVPLRGPPYVIDAGGRMSSLLGDHAASLLGVLRERDPAVGGVRLTGPPEEPEALIARGVGRPLVLAVRDAHRLPWQRELISRVLARRPDAVVIGTGAVHDACLARGSYVGTRGAGRANLAAAADVLLGRPGQG
jgi:beta-N-acetylhexosaminidase